MKNYRKPFVAGLFYPSNPDSLKNELSALFHRSQNTVDYKNIFGLISPHAGYIYSGRTAAHAYNLLQGKEVETVIIIAPSHREYFNGSCIFEGDGYLTPFGTIEIDKEMRDKIIASGKTVYTGKDGHRNEHAIEVQLPFIQMISDQIKIVPLVMGDQDNIFIDDLAQALASAVNEKTIIVASSDLSHFYPREVAEKLDSVLERNVVDLDSKTLLNNLEMKKCEACGGGPIAVLLEAARLMNKNKSAILHRSDSGNISGDITEVVGYLSAVVYAD